MMERMLSADPRIRALQIRALANAQEAREQTTRAFTRPSVVRLHEPTAKESPARRTKKA